MSESKDQWEKTQTKTFTKWFNNHLRKKNYPPLENPQTDFETGIRLMQIVNALYDVPIPKHNANPKLRPNKLDNIEIALKMVDDAKIKTNFLKHTHLVDHDLKMILGMMWAIILDYAIKGISEEEMTAKEGLLLWCRKKTAGYREVDPPGIQNFTTSWKNGLAFCALIHKHQPHLLDYESLSAANANENLEMAFSIAEKELAIPRLLDVEDMLVEKPDERSVMTYISEYFHRFAAQEAKEASARRAAKFLHFIRSTEELKKSYEGRAQALLQWVGEIIKGWEQETSGETLEEAQASIDRLKQFVLEDEPAHSAQKLELEQVYAEIQTQLKVNGRAAYNVPSDVSPDALDEAYHQLYLARQQHARKVRDHRYTFIKKVEEHVSTDQIDEFKQSFKHFAKNAEALNKEEFKAAAASVGVSLKDGNELNSTYASVSEGASAGVNEDQYVKYLVALTEDKDTPEQIKASFKQLANDKDTLTVDQLQIPPLTSDDAAYLASIMPSNSEGQFDYNAFVDAQYAQ